MIKNPTRIFLTAIFLMFLFFSHGQQKEIKGSIKYKAEINEKYVDSFLTALNNDEKTPMHIKQGVVEMYNNAQSDEFVLNFINSESYYYHIPTLNSEEGYKMGSLANISTYYTSNSINKIIEINPSLGNISHKPLQWEITSKTKTIGGYKCNQAIATEKLYSRKGYYYYRQAIAWFAPEIPISFGPSNYSGLPGLILQIHRDRFTITATEISLNSKEKIEIKTPKGKVITEEQSHSMIKSLEADRKKGG